MKAIVYRQYGSPDVLSCEEIEKPTPGDDEVLIGIRAASANQADWHFMRGEPYLVRAMAGLRKPRETRFGADLAGEVEATGRNVTRFRPGDAVFGSSRGAFAQYVCAHESRLALKPVSATFDEAAKLSRNNAVVVADSLIDLLLLPLREADAMFDRGGPEAMYVRAQAFIRENLRDPDLSIDRISAALGCTKRYLHMRFSDRGTTVSDYIWHGRLQNCRHELETHAGKTVTDVAFSWGFSSSSHFSRVFRKYFGIVPSSIHKAQHGGLDTYPYE